jgi:hypothetical protein
MRWKKNSDGGNLPRERLIEARDVLRRNLAVIEEERNNIAVDTVLGIPAEQHYDRVIARMKKDLVALEKRLASNN